MYCLTKYSTLKRVLNHKTKNNKLSSKKPNSYVHNM